MSANGRSPIDSEATGATAIQFAHALLTYPLDDALLSSAASFSSSRAMRAFDFAGPGSLEQIVRAPNWTDVGASVIDDPLAPISAGEPNAGLIWTAAGHTVVPLPGDWGDALTTAPGDEPPPPISGNWSGPTADLAANGAFGGAETQTGGVEGLDFGGQDELVRGIVDYTRADYALQLDHTAAAQLGPLGPLAQEAFHVGSAAADASDRIIYDSATGALYYDPDGTGAAAQVRIANLSPGLSLSAGTFIVI